MTSIPSHPQGHSRESLILASSSQRRREILEGLGLSFSCIPPDTDESLHGDLHTSLRVIELARDKTLAARTLLASREDGGRGSPRLILGADTLVTVPSVSKDPPRVLDGRGMVEEVFGKPANREEAGRMIARLEGNAHLVRTGIALLDRHSLVMLTARSDSIVHFASMSSVEIEAYLDTDEWVGAAGAYRVQGSAALFIDRIEGSWSGIVGLPIRELYEILGRIGFGILPNRQVRRG